MFDDLAGKAIMVTGASSGIGLACANLLSKHGAHLILVARGESALSDAESALAGGGHQTISYDLTASSDFSDLFDAAVGKTGKLSGLVHSAGISKVLPLKLMSRKRIEDEMRLNYFAFIELIRQYAKADNNDGGSIVGISSIAAAQPERGQANYAASKAAMDAAAVSIAGELAAKNIRVNTVLPGVTDTAMLKKNPNVDMDAIKSRQSLGVASPEDIANACAFLLSDASKMMTGRKLYMDGGRF